MKHHDIFSLYQLKFGCDFATALCDLSARNGSPQSSPAPEKKRKPVKGWLPKYGELLAQYDYNSADGALLFQIGKFPDSERGKTFKGRQPVPGRQGFYFMDLQGLPRVLYRLLEVMKAESVWLAEGEKDADLLHNLGFCGTTAPHGAGKWSGLVEKYRIHEPLKGRTVYIIPDNDDAGRAHAEQVARTLHGFASCVKILDLSRIWPEISERGDVSDFVSAVGDDEAWEKLMAFSQSAPEFVPAPEEANPKKKTKDKKTAYIRLKEAYDETGSKVFLDDRREGWLWVRKNDHYENVPLNSNACRRWLLSLYVMRYGELCPPETVKGFVDLLMAQAEAACGELRTLKNRFSWEGDRLLIDMATPEWDVIEVNAECYSVKRLEDASPFKRYSHQQRLPHPEPGGSVKEVLGYVPIKTKIDGEGCRDERAQILFLVWLVTTLLEHIPRPIPNIHGGHGTGKTTQCEFIRSLVDPSMTPTLGTLKDGFDLTVQLDKNACLPLDNLSFFPDWVSDIICRAVTGTGFSTRELYTTMDDHPIFFRRLVILNGINPVGGNPDLMDRCILFETDPIETTDRKYLTWMREQFEEARPRIFGAMLQALSDAMRILPTIDLKELPRMADWALWGCAAAEAMGIPHEAFVKAYFDSIDRRDKDVALGGLVSGALIEFMDGRSAPWEGTPTKLLEELTEFAKDTYDTRSKQWPKSPNALSRALNKFRANLLAVRLSVEYVRNERSRTVIINPIESRKNESCPDCDEAPVCPIIGARRNQDDCERFKAEPRSTEPHDGQLPF